MNTDGKRTAESKKEANRVPHPFYCYSLKLKSFLKRTGIHYNCCARHYKTGKMFWVFERSDALSAALDEWNKHKQEKW
jgi:hypothetical protein